MKASKTLPAWLDALLNVAELALTSDDQAAIVLLAHDAAPRIYKTCEFRVGANRTRKNALRTLVATATRAAGEACGYVAVRARGKIMLFTGTNTVLAQRVVSESNWTVQFGSGNYLLTEDGTRIAYFATASEAHSASSTGHVVQRACAACRKHADEFHGCDCNAGARLSKAVA
jgi:hypothetical protein